VIDDYSLLPQAHRTLDVIAARTGYLAELDAELVGRAAVTLGAGRERVDSVIDPGVGIDVRVVLGERVNAGDSIMRVSYNDASRSDEARAMLDRAIRIADAPPAVQPVIRAVIGSA
jgi:pyrimidine-nucleoside phosphorylase